MRLFLITTIVSGPGLIAARSVIPMSVIYGSISIKKVLLIPIKRKANSISYAFIYN